ncbi:MAG: outer membrane beta-barrel protein [Bacteroidales bacterium]|nr:outer membrane beta-barrel protein [Bacteroidales bacterium]
MRFSFNSVIIILLIITYYSIFNTPAFSQNYRLPPNLPDYDSKPYHFGFTLGVNSMNFVIKYVDDFRQYDSLCIIESKPQEGFTIGIVSNLRLGWDYADLRFIPTLSFGDRQLHYTIINKGKTKSLQIKKIESTFLEFPFSLRVKSMRFNNNALVYIMGGVKYSIDMASQAKQKEEDGEVVIKLKRNDYAYEVGVGMDFYLVYFKLGTELKMVYGLKDLLKRENNVYTDPIKKLNSKIFMLSFTFE